MPSAIAQNFASWIGGIADLQLMMHSFFLVCVTDHALGQESGEYIAWMPMGR